ncbi:MAG: hypothetical protein AB3N63_06795 [Puniceicoccaceae bacterium]
MLFTRKIGKFLRGKATPFQIISATVLGALLGSLPGVTQGPLLLVILLFLLIVLNANIFLAGITLLLVKLISLILLPIYFQIGMILLESPLSGLIAKLANAPVTAWFGLDHYVMLPSLIVGLLIGFFLGVMMSRSLRTFRKKMGSLEEGSEKYQAYASKFWVKSIAWILVGGLSNKGKKNWTEMADNRKGMPIRPLGIVFVVSLGILGFLGLKLMDTTIVTSSVRDALEDANGATVDIEAVEVLPGENRVIVTGLAMADPEALENNRFASRQVVADISGMNILAKKVVIDSLQILEPKAGTPRKVPGRLTVDIPEPPKTEPVEEVYSIDDYLGQASVWKERLATLKRVYDRIAPYVKKDGKEEKPKEPGEPGWREQLIQRAKAEGYAKIKSENLISGSPRFWVRELVADNLEIGGNDDLFAISGLNLSSQPALLAESGVIKVTRMDGDFDVELGLPNETNPNQSSVKIRYANLAVSELEEAAGKDLPMDGGTLDLVGEGVIDGAVLRIPVKVTMNNTTLNAFGNSLPLDKFPVEIQVLGPLDQPKLKIPSDAFENALEEAGKAKLKNVIEEKAGDQLKGLFDKLGG